MNTHHDKGEFDRLKDELRRLKRAGAPWYFESELHRRLHGTGHRHRRLRAFPGSTAFVITLVAVGCLAGAAYLMMVQAGLFKPALQEPVQAVHSAVADSVAPASLVAPASQVAPASPPVKKQVGQASPPVIPKPVTKPLNPDTSKVVHDTSTVAQDTIKAPKSP